MTLAWPSTRDTGFPITLVATRVTYRITFTDWDCGVPAAACSSARTIARRANSILKLLWAKPDAPCKIVSAASAEHFAARLLAFEKRLRGRNAPRLMGDPAQRKARDLDSLRLKLKADGDGNKSEGVGQSIPDLQIGVVAGESLRRQLDRGDDFVGARLVSNSGLCPGRR